MKKKQFRFFSYLCILSLLLIGCEDTAKPKPKGTRDNTPVVLEPTAPQTNCIGNDKVTFDISNASEGYTVVFYSGTSEKVKVRITNPDESIPYTYDIHEGVNVFPFTGGNGMYTLQAFEHIEGTTYSTLFSQQQEITLKDEYTTFLYPNQYVNFNKDTIAIQKGKELAKVADTDLDVVANVYDYVIENIAYDDDKAKKAKDGELSGYLPVVDETLSSQTGICFDYAALMATMLKSQSIPTRLLIGNVKTDEGILYHAWIGVYIHDVGWIDNIIEFDGKEWSMMDPTLASENRNSKTIKEFISNTENYSTKFMY